MIPAGLLSPLWLLALAAILFPLILHLISRGRFRRIRVGSISLLSGDSSRRGSRILLSQWPLLLVRCLLLAALALALAGPRSWIDPKTPSGGDRAWVLADREVLEDRDRPDPIYPEAARAIDELAAEGSRLKILMPGFPLWQDARDVAPAAVPAGTWTLLREADATAPPEIVFHVFSVGSVERIQGSRPRFTREVRWTAVSPAGENRWIQRLAPAGEEGLDLIIGTSGPGGTTFERHRVESLQGSEVVAEQLERQGERLGLRNGGLDESDDWIEADLDREPLAVRLIRSSDREEDASYMKAALASVERFAGVPVDRIDQRVGEGGPPASRPADLTIWLAGEPVPPALAASLAPGQVLISDADGTDTRCDTRALSHPPDPPVRISMRRCATAVPAAGFATIWSDGFGRPFLQAGPAGEGTWYRLHTRLLPAWSDLPVSAALPEWLAGVVEGMAGTGRVRTAVKEGSDRRAAPVAGGTLTSAELSGSEDHREADPLPEYLLWFLVAALLAVERGMATAGAYRRKVA